MKIIEQFTKGKADKDELNEDCIVINDNFIAVLDGVTSKNCPKIDGASGGRFAARSVAEFIDSFEQDITAKEAIDGLSKDLMAIALDNGISFDKYDTPACGIIIYSKFRKEIWAVSDLQLVVDGKFFDNSKEIDKITSNARACMSVILLTLGLSEEELISGDPGRELIKPLLNYQHLFRNKSGPYGFGVINGKEIPDEFIKTFDVSDAKEIILASDGYPEVLPTLAESEAFLESVLKEDPLLIKKYKSTKGLKTGNVSFDDRAYVRFLTK